MRINEFKKILQDAIAKLDTYPGLGDYEAKQQQASQNSVEQSGFISTLGKIGGKFIGAVQNTTTATHGSYQQVLDSKKALQDILNKLEDNPTLRISDVFKQQAVKILYELFAQSARSPDHLSRRDLVMGSLLKLLEIDEKDIQLKTKSMPVSVKSMGRFGHSDQERKQRQKQADAELRWRVKEELIEQTYKQMVQPHSEKQEVPTRNKRTDPTLKVL